MERFLNLISDRRWLLSDSYLYPQIFVRLWDIILYYCSDIFGLQLDVRCGAIQRFPCSGFSSECSICLEWFSVLCCSLHSLIVPSVFSFQCPSLKLEPDRRRMQCSCTWTSNLCQPWPQLIGPIRCLLLLLLILLLLLLLLLLVVIIVVVVIIITFIITWINLQKSLRP